MAFELTAYRIFLATPNGLEEERRAFREIINEYNESDALDRGVMFCPTGWEALAPRLGRPQALINQDLRKCDYFILALWDRWGSPPDLEGKYSSGTEEEFQVALECYGNETCPMRQIAAFFKSVSPDRLSDPGPQLQKVLSFKKELDESKKIFFATFEDSLDFSKHVRRLLAHWLRNHERSQLEPIPNRGPLFNVLGFPAMPGTLSAAADQGVPASKLVVEAERLATQGQITEAEAFFARAILESNDLDALNRYGHFLVQLGRLSQAAVVYERILAIARPGQDDWKAEAYGNLGLIHRTRGELRLAEELQRKALEIDIKLARTEQMAVHYGNLGLVLRTSGDLAQALEMHEKALAIEKDTGRIEGMAIQYGNLGVVCQMLGELERAERMQRKALGIEQRLDRAGGIATACGNLGAILLERARLDEAEDMLEKALEIDTRLGRAEGMANHFGHLGALYRLRGNWELAKRTLEKAVEINEQLGRPKGLAENYNDIALVLSDDGDLEGAERNVRKALGINEKLGRSEARARGYVLLGKLYRSRGEAVAAKGLLVRARNLFIQLGLPHRIREVEHELANCNAGQNQARASSDSN